MTIIDKKNLNKEAEYYAEGVFRYYVAIHACKLGFKRGAIWAQKEFVNSLWHDAGEEPEKGKTFLVSMRNHGDHKISYYLDDSGDVLKTFTSWSAYASYFGVTRWCYLEDILPKKGGEK